MTQVAMIFEEEKQQAIQQAVEQAVKQTIEAERKKAVGMKQQAVEAERKRAMDAQQQTIVKMIEKGYPTEEIVFLVSGCSQNEVDALRKNM